MKSAVQDSDEPTAITDEPQIILKTATFTNGTMLVTLGAGSRISDQLLIKRARAAGVDMLPESQSHTHACCPCCGTVFELPHDKIEPRYAGLTHGELSLAMRRR